MRCLHITCQFYSSVMVGFPPDTESMIPRPMAITRPMMTHTGDTCRSTPPYHSAASAPINSTKYPIRYMFMKRMAALRHVRKDGRAKRLPSFRAQTLLHQSHGQRRAPVETPRLFTRVVVLRPFLTVADRLEAIGGDPAAHEVVLH